MIRPYVAINMVTTIDGKILTGERDEHVMDLGSDEDHRRMRELQDSMQAVLIGAGALRATPKIWYPKNLVRIVVTASGNLPWHSRFFTDAPHQAIVVSPASASLELPEGVEHWPAEGSDIDFAAVLTRLHQSRGIERLIAEGGSELNAQLLKAELVDELYLTLAPKIKLGRNVPTYADGEPLSRKAVQTWHLVSCETVDDEIFLRYRKDSTL